MSCYNWNIRNNAPAASPGVFHSVLRELSSAVALTCDFIRADVNCIEEQYRLKYKTNRLENAEKTPFKANGGKKRTTVHDRP